MKKLIVLVLCLVAILPSAVSQLDASVDTKNLQKYVVKTCKPCTIKEINQNNAVNSPLQGKFYHINNRKTPIEYAYVGRVNSCRADGCEIKDSKSGVFEYFDYFVILNLDYQITKISIFNYQATHGQEVCAPSWLKQFYGYKGEKKLVVGKDIDAISGATTSVNSFTTDIQEVCKQVRLIK